MANTSSDSHAILQKLINNLSGDLRQLSNETKKKYPPIKEAAEACNMKLREFSTLKDNLSTGSVIAPVFEGAASLTRMFTFDDSHA